MWSNTSLSCAALVAVVLFASHASGQTKTDDVEQLKKELAALRAEVKVLKEEVARLTREEEEVKAKKQLAESVEVWKRHGAVVTERSPLTFIRDQAVSESVAKNGESGNIPVFSFIREKKRELARNEIPPRDGDRFTYDRVSTYTEGMLRHVPDPGMPFGLDLGGVESLSGLARLKSLQLLRAAAGDAELKELAGLKNLKWLDLRSTKVTDTGLKELAGLKNLQWLDLYGTQVTDEGVAALQKALPACKIQR